MNIYDFDNTIYDGDSSVDFFKFCIKKNKKCLLILPYFFLACLFYLVKIKEKEYLKSAFFRFLKYFDEIDPIVQEFWDKNTFKIKDFYLKQKKHTDIIISASPYFLLYPLTEKLNIKLIATDVEKKTGKLIGLNCYGIEKVKRLNEIDITSCNKFYSDSLSDLPVSKLAKESYIVKGNEIINWSDYKLSFVKKIKKMFFSRDFITFVAIGLINVLNGVWIAYVYSLFINSPILAYVLGFITSLTIAYFLNSLLNFKVKLSWKKYFRFCFSNIPNFLIQIFSVIVLINYLHISKLLSYFISAVVAVPITFMLVKFNVFNKSSKEVSK